MSQRSLYKKVEQKPKPRQVDYTLIYEHKDAGKSINWIVKELGISYGTIQHALRLRKQGKV